MPAKATTLLAVTMSLLLAGAAFGQLENITTIRLSYIGDLGDGTGDKDGDGLTDWQEVKQTHTDPRHPDTDGDGVFDRDELLNGTDPLNPDSNGDLIPDGQLPYMWRASSLWANATNANFVISLADAKPADRAVVRIGDLAFFLLGTNTVGLCLSPGLRYRFEYKSVGGKRHVLSARFAELGGVARRGDPWTDYGWMVDDPGGIFSGASGSRGEAAIALASISLIPLTGTCVHDGTGCVFRVVMSPDDWQRAKSEADLDNLALMPDGNLFLPVPDTPGEYAEGTITIGYPYLREGTIGQGVSAHRCEGWSGLLCPICGTYHDSENSCDHDPQCAAGHSPPEECDCDPIQVPFNCDDDDNDGHEDRTRQDLATGEDDCVPFSPMRAGDSYCCCNRVSFSVRVNSISSNLRLWERGARLQAGSVSDGGDWTVEGIATNTSGQTSRISYTVLDGDENEVVTITRKFVVSPSVSFSFDADSVLPDGGVVVVKRSTNPVRINDTTVNVHASGLADGSYRLVADRAKFNFGDQYTAVSLDQGEGGAAMYGDIPSSTMGDATLSLQTVGGTTLCTTNFTVLWVEISMRCGQGDDLSSDNACLANFGPNCLGKSNHPAIPFFQNGSYGALASGIGNVVEFCGTVRPSDFGFGISLLRDRVGEYVGYIFDGQTIITTVANANIPRGIEPAVNDLSQSVVRDDDPRPNGNIYDVDTPGLQTGSGVGGSMNPVGTIVMTRLNFKEYAVFNGRRCSNDFNWYSRTTVIKTSGAGVATYNFHARAGLMDENEAGGGTTSIAP